MYIWKSFILPVVGVLLFASCKKHSEQDRDTVTVGLSSGPSTLDPRFATDAAGMRIDNLIFSSFVRIGQDLTVVADAAESWTYKDLTYIFVLRPDIAFAHGRLVEPEDILFSFQQYMSPNSPYNTSLQPISEVTATTVEGEGKKRIHVKLKLKSFAAPLLTDLTTIKILPREIVQSTGQDFGSNLTGSGSFKFISQNANEIVLEAVQNHAWAAPKIKKVIFKIIHDDNTLYLNTLKGNIDLSQAEIAMNKVASLEKHQDFTVHKYPGLSMSYLVFNLRDPDLKNLDVRKVFALGVDRQEIIDFKLDRLATPATSLLSPVNPFHFKDLKPISTNKSLAKELVKKLGLQNKTFTIKSSNNPEVLEIGKVFANQLTEVGLNIKTQSFEWGTFYQDVKSGNFQVASMRWVGLIDPDIYRDAFHSGQFPPGKNRGYYQNPALDKLLDEGAKIEDMGKRIAHYKQIQEKIMNDMPILPLWYRTQVSVVHKRIKNYQPTMNGDFFPLVTLSKEVSNNE